MPRSHAKITLTQILISDMCCDVPSDDSVEVSVLMLASLRIIMFLVELKHSDLE